MGKEPIYKMDRELVHEILTLFIPPPKPGERVVIDHWEEMVATVIGSQWLPKEDRYKIYLDWGEHGSSHVFSSDEGTVWRRYLEVN